MLMVYENLPLKPPPKQTRPVLEHSSSLGETSGGNNNIDQLVRKTSSSHNSRPVCGLEPFLTTKLPIFHTKSFIMQNNRPGDEGEISLEHVHGITIPTGSVFVSHPESGRLAYAAGCTIVVVDSNLTQQSHIINSSKNEIVSLAFSADGALIATGESGHAPAVRLWDLATKQECAVFVEHKFSIPFVAFSPDKKYLVSVGNQNDQTIALWNIERRLKLYPAKTTSKVNALSFSPDSKHFITVGVRFARIWYIRENERDHSIYLEGFSPHGPISTKTFTAVTYINPTYIVAATAKSLLQITINEEINRNVAASPAISRSNRWRLLESNEKKIYDTKMIYALLKDPLGEKILVACSNGVVKAFTADTLEPLFTNSSALFRPHELDCGEGCEKNDGEQKKNGKKYGDTIAMAFINNQNMLATVYSNHSIYIWDITEIEKVKRVSYSMFHASNIYDVDICPAVPGSLMPNIIASCSNDSTIRFWKSEDHTLLRTIYCDLTDLAPLCDGRAEENLRKRNENEALLTSPKMKQLMEFSASLSPRHHASLTKHLSLSSTVATGNNNNNNNNNNLLPVVNNSCAKWIVSTITFRPDGRELATGYRNGYIRILDLSNFSIIHESQQDAKEILVLAYSQISSLIINGAEKGATSSSPQFLAISGGNFQNIVVLNASNGYSLHQAFTSGHSSFVNGLRFAQSKQDFESNKIWLISSSQDKLLVFHEAKFGDDSAGGGNNVRFKGQSFTLIRSVALPCSPHSMLINEAQDVIALACHDRKVRLVDISSGKISCSYLGTNVNGKISHQLKRFDSSNVDNLLATVCSDKTISLLARPWDMQEEPQANEWLPKTGISERVLASTTGHGDGINGIKFLPGHHLVTVSADSCLFLWKFVFHLVPIKPKPSELTPSRAKTVRRKSAGVSSTSPLKDNHLPITRSLSARTINVKEQRSVVSASSTARTVKPAWNNNRQKLTRYNSSSDAFVRQTSSSGTGKQQLDTDRQRFQKNVENLIENIDNICSSFDGLELEPDKKASLLAAVREASSKLNNFLLNKTEQP